MSRFRWSALCVALFALLYCFPLAADTCAPIEVHVAKMLESPSAEGHKPLTGLALQKVIAYVQSINGDTTKYDTGYIAWSSTHLVLFVGNGGTICTGYVGPRSALEKLIEVAEGRSA